MNIQIRRILVVLLNTGIVASCTTHRSEGIPLPGDERTEVAKSSKGGGSPGVATRLAELRSRFGLDIANPAESFPGARLRPTTVTLPMRADGQVRIDDDRSGVSVGFSLDNVRYAPIETTAGIALYRGAVDGSDLLHRVSPEGTEDYVVFEKRPAREELTYAIEVTRVPGLRLVSDTLEFLDEGGSPVLRVAPPFVIDSTGRRHGAWLALSGCAYDVDARAPWGRSITRPGAERCRLLVTWASVAYPALVDPAWGATGSMASARASYSATTLPSGRVLVAGGRLGFDGYLASAELFDAAGNGGAGAFAATGSMGAARQWHTATSLGAGRVLVAGGAGGATFASAEVYDETTGTFNAAGPMNFARQKHTANALPGGKVLIVGGSDGGDDRSAEIFNPAGAGIFAVTGSLSRQRPGHTATTLLSGKVLIAGCNSPSCDSELFDPAAGGGAGAFVSAGGMVQSRSGHTATLLPSGKVLVAGGKVNVIGPILASAELFDPSASGGAGAFAASGFMTKAVFSHTATLLPTGRVLIAGGRSTDSLSATTELFDPAGNAGMGTFAAAGSMSLAREEHTANILPSGKVLVIGPSAAAELFGGSNAEPCSAGGYCLSGYCVDGVCCDSSCGSACDRCDVAGSKGACTAAPLGATATPACLPYLCDGSSKACPTSCSSDTVCGADFYCSSRAVCEPRKPQGAGCDAKADCKQASCRSCASSFCVDGFCCDKGCTGTCLACSAALKFSSSADGVCDAAKAGPDPEGTVCTEPQAACDDDNGLKGANGTIQDCKPYKCIAGACSLQCSSVSDCVSPTVCDSSGKCVQPPDTGDAGGCAVAKTRRGPGDAGGALVFALSIVYFARRRERHRWPMTSPPPRLRSRTPTPRSGRSPR